MSRTVGTVAAESLESCYAAGQDALTRGELDEARQWLARAEALPGAEEHPHTAGLRGSIAAWEGDAAAALVRFREALARISAPAERAVIRDGVETLVECGAMAEALALLEEAAGRARESPTGWMELAYLRLMNGDAPGARAAADRAMELQPQDPTLCWELARVYEAAEDPARAAEALSRLDGDAAPTVVLARARLALDLARYAEAEDWFRRLRRLDPELELVAQHGLVWCRIRRGDWRGALEASLDATRLDRMNLTTRFLAYARDRLFGRAPDALLQEAELEERFRAELRLHGETKAAA